MRYNPAMSRSIALLFALASLALGGGAWADLSAAPTYSQALAGQPEIAALIDQLQGREFAVVATEAERMVAEIEARTDRYDAALTAPLTLLGDARMGLDQADLALEAYDRAKHITRIADGVQSLDQIVLLFREASALEATGDRKGANERHEFAYSLRRRHHDPDSPEFLPAIEDLIAWYRRHYRHRAAQVLYEMAIDIMREHYESDDRRIIDALRGYADTFRQRRFGARQPGRGGFSAWPPGENKDPPWYKSRSYRRARNALQEVLELTKGRSDSTDAEIAAATLELADWHLLYDHYGIAMRHYRRVWSLLESDARAEVFANPTPLYVPTPNRRAKQVGADASSDGIVVLALTITHRGDVVGRKTLRAEPDDVMEFMVRKAAKQAIYRPAFANADPVRWNGLTLEYRYEYRDDRWSR